MRTKFLIITSILLLGALTLSIQKGANKQAFRDVTEKSIPPNLESHSSAAWGDYNNDGYLDLVIQGREGVGLLENGGNGTFKYINQEWFKSICCPTKSAVFGDYDNDGFLDLFITTNYDPAGKHYLYLNDKGRGFINVAERSGINCDGHGEGAAWGDYNNDGYLDLFVVNFGINYRLKNDFENEKSCLFKNNGDGTFIEVSESAGIPDVPTVNLVDRYGTNPPIVKKSLPFQPVWFDYNNDNWLDLFIAIDSGASPLYRNNGDGTFTDVTEKVGLNKYGTGMGVAIGDFNDDLFQDIYVTNEGQNYLWKNIGGEGFNETSINVGIDDPFGFGWGTIFLDHDNDGDLDLFVANGVIEEIAEDLEIPESIANRNAFFENINNLFKNITAKSGLEDSSSSRGAAVADFDNNGFLDIITLSSPGAEDRKLKLYKNLGNKNSWITLRLVGTKSNRDGIGAKVWVTAGGKTQYQQVIAGSSYASQNSIWPHFGLGKVKKVDKVEILWPSGIRQVLRDVKANQIIEVTEEEN